MARLDKHHIKYVNIAEEVADSGAYPSEIALAHSDCAAFEACLKKGG